MYVFMYVNTCIYQAPLLILLHLSSKRKVSKLKMYLRLLELRQKSDSRLLNLPALETDYKALYNIYKFTLIVLYVYIWRQICIIFCTRLGKVLILQTFSFFRHLLHMILKVFNQSSVLRDFKPFLSTYRVLSVYSIHIYCILDIIICILQALTIVKIV